MLRGNNYAKSNAGSTVGTPSMKRANGPSPATNTSSDTMSAELARKRQSRKDEAIRKKLDQELGKKKPVTRAHGSTKAVQGTVGALRPSSALTLKDTALVVDAARIMAAKRADAVLVIDEDQHLVGIMTDKDLAFRVVAEGLDIRSTLLSQVMTRNPFCVTTDTNATEALNKMVNGGFRHLPVCDDDGDVVGLLDITKCLFEALEKLEKAHQSSKKLFDALEGIKSEWAQPANPEVQHYVELMREKMASPDLNTILDEGHGVAEIQAKTSVREASRIMKDYHSTASLVMEDGRIAGIFTTKDIVVRVMAAGQEPDRTSVVRVMTPHPDTVNSSMTILEALKKMHDNRYLHLPVVDDQGHLAGLVDVLQVSLAMLRQMNSIQTENNAEGPVWNKFWESTFARDETGSEVSASDVRSGYIAPSDVHYTSHAGSSLRLDSPMPTRQDVVGEDMVMADFTFKFKGQDGKAHRFASSPRSYSELYNRVVEKMGGLEDKSALVTISYCDEENDQVLIVQDADVLDAVQMANRNHWPLLRLTVAVSSPEKGQRRLSSGQLLTGSGSGSVSVSDNAPSAGEVNPFTQPPALISGAAGFAVGATVVILINMLRK